MVVEIATSDFTIPFSSLFSEVFWNIFILWVFDGR